MQYTSQIPLYYHERDKSSHGFSRHLFNANAYYNDYRKQQCLGYDKETMRQIIQNQDKTFRHQVRELHRLYARQRELMDDIKMREIYDSHSLTQSKSIFPCLSQAAHDDATQFPGFDSVSNIFGLNEEKTSLTSITGQVEERRRSSPCDLLSEKKSKFFIDLNVPFMPESLMSSSTVSSCLLENTHRDHHMGCAIDLNTEPCDVPSESAGRHGSNFSSENSEEKLHQPLEGFFPSEDTITKKNTTDRMAVFVDGISSDNDGSFSKAKTCIDMNTDVDKELEEPVQELDRAAAETLVGIFSSARIDRRPTDAIITDGSSKTSYGSLSWLADIISSLDDDEDEVIKIHNQYQLVPSERTEDKNRTKPSSVKRKSLNLSRAVRKETQSGSTRLAARDVNRPKCMEADERTNVRKHRGKLTSQYNARKPGRSTLRQLDARNKQCVLRDWGKMKKRGGFRRRKYASS